MPYDSVADLPASLREHLPRHAQEIYLASFNAAWEHYAKPGTRRGKQSREATAHRVAWSAVEKKYEKQGDRWVRKT